MGDLNVCFKEATPYQSSNDGWKEINLNTGGTQSTLQDIKVVERSSGYSYIDSSKHYTRNRFIYWHINNDILEIAEQSLDLNLTGNKLRYKFVDTPILDGVTVHEFENSVIILVPTVCSVHRLVFPHPRRLHRQDDFLGSHPDLSVPSIFAEASVSHARDPKSFYIFNNPSSANAQLPHCAASHFIEETEEAFFLFAYPSNEIILVRQSEMGESDTIELKHESIMPRFLSGIADKLLNKNLDASVVTSMLLHSFGGETYALTLARDGNLRTWNCTKGQCIAVNDISDLGNRQRIQGTQNHMLRKFVGQEEDDFILAVYLSFSSQCQFYIFKPSFYNGQFQLNRINILQSPRVDLVDFSVSITSIWSVWRGEGGECSVYTASCFASGNNWVPVTLESIPENAENFFTPDVDPCQAYLEHIFYPGRFPLNIINKALSIYKRSATMNDLNLSPAVLKQRISMAVENEIQSELNDCVVNDDEYFECANWCWSRFYSCCVQYYVAALRPLGILQLPNANSAILLKKSMYSMLRPVDILEQLLVSYEYPDLIQFIDHPQLVELGEIEDLIELIGVLDSLDKQTSDLFKATFEREMSQLCPPDEIISELNLVNELTEEFQCSITESLKGVDLYRAIHKLLDLLRMDKSAESNHYEATKDAQMSINHIFSSIIGVSFISKTLKQQAEVRFSICRNLLTLLHILLVPERLNSDISKPIHNVCLPETVVLTQAYYILVWFNKLPSMPTLPGKAMLQRLTPLKLAPAFNMNTTPNQNNSLLDLFIVSSAGYTAHKNIYKLYEHDENFVQWQNSLLTYIDQIIQIIWPVNVNPLLPEWLLVSGQHLILQNYVRLMNNWGECGQYTRNFLLATAFLCTGEYNKALNLYTRARNGMLCEQYLVEKVMNDNMQDADPRMWYFLKVIYLFENHGARSFAIDLSNEALNQVKDHDPLKATLYSIKFKHHLALGHYERAYDALTANPDIERKKANLRDFVKTLLEEKQLDLLMSFPYTDLEQLFTSILSTRARATDSIDNVYYDFLYAYHVKRGPLFMRLAAGVMYEQAFRLMQYNTMESLEKQMKCYLAAVNALHICDKKFAWVLKPADPDLDEEEIVFPVPAGSRDECQKIYIKQQVDIIPLEDLKREMEFTGARLKIAKYDINTLTARVTTPNELVAILNNCGHYKTALQLCTAFEMPYDSVFQSLTQQCVLLTKKDNPNAWQWLVENDLHDLSIIANKPGAVAWNLLQTYLFEYEKENCTQLHKVVCDKLITMKFCLPHWLLASYKLRNAGELLRIFLFRGYLEGAYNLATEHILAALGFGVEHFGYKHGLVHDGPALCLPVHVIDSLIYELELQNQVNPKKPFEKEHEALKELFVKYLQTSSRISNEVMRSKLSGVRA